MCKDVKQMSGKHLDEIEYWCTQLMDGSALERIPDIFSLDFMHEYTTFLSFSTMLDMLNAGNVENVDDLVRIDTTDADTCISQFSEFGSWKELVVTACDYYIAANVK